LLYDTLHAYGYASSAVSNDRRSVDACRLPDHQFGEMPAAAEQADAARNAHVQRLPGGRSGDAAAGGAILALGRVAHDAALLALGARRSDHPFAHGTRHALANGAALFDSYHCSRYNTTLAG
jgi:hypothetical protein